MFNWENKDRSFLDRVIDEASFLFDLGDVLTRDRGAWLGNNQAVRLGLKAFEIEFGGFRSSSCGAKGGGLLADG